MGRGNNAPKGGKRGCVDGWSRSAVRRHLEFLYSVDVPRLDGSGFGVTLTVRNTPPTHTEWMSLLQKLIREFRAAGLSRWHWVVEWQRRGTPHLHLAVYAPDGWTPSGSPITDIMSVSVCALSPDPSPVRSQTRRLVWTPME
ncbi:rolling circle replication-associated protein [Nocardioides astragali]|uniref:rolling circle replication-associated protein n=1 Tax=Nocardioides astragali TaxID=1776736 RepID=UPI003FD7C156